MFRNCRLKIGHTSEKKRHALPEKIQEAVELYFVGEDTDIPKPTPLETLAQRPDYEGGVWMTVDIDLSRIRPKAMRLNITLTQPCVETLSWRLKAVCYASHAV